MTRSELTEIHCNCGRSADFRLCLSSGGIDRVAVEKRKFREYHPEGGYAVHKRGVKHRILSWEEALERTKR